MSAAAWQAAAPALQPETAVVLTVAFFVLAAVQTVCAARRALRREPGWARTVYEWLLVLHLALGLFAAWVVLRHLPPWLGSAAGAASAPFAFLLPNALVLAWGLALAVHGRRASMLPELACAALMTPPAAWALGAWWPWAVALDAACLAVRVVSTLVAGTSAGAGRPSGASVAQAVKDLPEGVLCARPDGRVLVMNDAMRDCLRALGFSTDLADTSGLWEGLQDAARRGGAGAVLPEGVRLEVAPGQIRLFMRDEVELGGRLCRRLVAVDVTDLERLVIQVEEANRRLEETGELLRASMDGVEEVARNEALIAMRSRVHDVIGQRLSILHRYLEDGGTGASFGRMAALLAGIADDLRAGTEAAPAAADDLAAVVAAFALIDVDVRVAGELPDDPAAAAAFARMVREASTNAVRHAQASAVRVALGRDGGCATCAVANDGAPCAGEPRSGGGLLGMRAAAEALGGTLEVDPGPPFTVRMRVPCADDGRGDGAGGRVAAGACGSAAADGFNDEEGTAR